MTDRLMDLEAHREWCEAWLARQDVKHPQITQEWVNLLEEVAWAVEEIESLRLEFRAVVEAAQGVHSCTANEYDPNRWHVRKDAGRRFSGEIKKLGQALEDLRDQDCVCAETDPPQSDLGSDLVNEPLGPESKRDTGQASDEGKPAE